jgi:hypothetical protein
MTQKQRTGQSAPATRLAKPYAFVPSDADADVVNEPQYTDVPQRLGVKKAA